MLSCCWQDEHHILIIIAQQGIWGQWPGAMTHEDAGWSAPAWAPGLTQRESYLILPNTIPPQKLWLGSSCQAVDNLMDWTQNLLIDNEGAVLLACLHHVYLDFLGDEDSQYPACSLYETVLKFFPSLILTKSGNTIIVHSEQMRTEAAMRLACYDERNLKTTANYLQTLML